jgi:hypothetical protein
LRQFRWLYAFREHGILVKTMGDLFLSLTWIFHHLKESGIITISDLPQRGMGKEGKK